MIMAQKKQHTKLLSGYGLSVSLKNNQIKLKDGKDLFDESQDSEEWYITKIPYNRIVVTGKGYISTESIQLLSENNVNLVVTDSFGNLTSTVSGIMSSGTATQNRIAQYATLPHPALHKHNLIFQKCHT